MLGVRAFFCAEIAHLQHKLPLHNIFYKILDAQTPKRGSVRAHMIAFRAHVDVSCFLDEWKAVQAEGDVAMVNKEQRIGHYWNEIFAHKSVTNTNRYSVLSYIIKSGLVGTDVCRVRKECVHQ